MADDTPSGRLVSTTVRGATATREDFVLLAVPSLLLPAFVVGIVTFVPLPAALGIASVFAAGVLADAVFVHPPTER